MSGEVVTVENGRSPMGFDSQKLWAIGGEVVESLNRAGLKAAPEFSLALHEYYLFAVGHVKDIEETLQSKVTSFEVTMAFRSLGEIATRNAQFEGRSLVTESDLREALSIAKGEMPKDKRPGKEPGCPHPDCFRATAALIRKARLTLAY